MFPTQYQYIIIVLKTFMYSLDWMLAEYMFSITGTFGIFNICLVFRYNVFQMLSDIAPVPRSSTNFLYVMRIGKCVDSVTLLDASVINCQEIH